MKKKVKNGNRYCKICRHHLQQKRKCKNKTSYRWYCLECHKYTIINKKTKERHLFI